jgi:hypothetical protein
MEVQIYTNSQAILSIRPQIAKAILSKMSNAGGIRIPNFKPYYRAIATKTDMNTRKEYPDMNPHSYAHIIF